MPFDFTVKNMIMPHPVYAWMGMDMRVKSDRRDIWYLFEICGRVIWISKK